MPREEREGDGIALGGLLRIGECPFSPSTSAFSSRDRTFQLKSNIRSFVTNLTCSLVVSIAR